MKKVVGEYESYFKIGDSVTFKGERFIIFKLKPVYFDENESEMFFWLWNYVLHREDGEYYGIVSECSELNLSESEIRNRKINNIFNESKIV
jgi:hypothetical protein